MGTWFQTDNSPQSRDGARGQEVIFTYRTERDNGHEEAAARGYGKGVKIVYKGAVLALADIGVRNVQGGYDDVDLRFESVDMTNPPKSARTRAEGESEWTIEADIETRVASWSESYESGGGEEPTEGKITIYKPKAVLVWRKWIKKTFDYKDPNARKYVLPSTLTEALEMAETYTEGGSFEISGPIVGARLANADNKWLCTDVQIDEDGQLMVRTARFLHHPDGWNTVIYPTECVTL